MLSIYFCIFNFVTTIVKSCGVFGELLSIVGNQLSKQRLSQRQYRQSATGSFPDSCRKGELINFSLFGGQSYCRFPRFRPFRVSVICSLRCLISPRQKRMIGVVSCHRSLLLASASHPSWSVLTCRLFSYFTNEFRHIYRTLRRLSLLKLLQSFFVFHEIFVSYLNFRVRRVEIKAH